MREAIQASPSAERLQVYQGVQQMLETIQPDFKRFVELGGTIKRSRAQLFTGGDQLTVSSQRLVDEATKDGNSQEIAAASQLESAMLLVRVANWRFLATHDPNGPTTFKANAEQAAAVLGRFDRQVDNAERRADVARVASDLEMYRQNFQDVSEAMLRTDQLYSESIAPPILEGQQRLESTRLGVLNEVGDVQHSTDRQLSAALWLEAIIAAALLALGAFLAFVIARTIALPLSVSAIKVHSNTQQIAATAKEQQATATEIAATTTEIGATSREIFATSKELVKTMQEVANVAEQTAALADSGQIALTDMETTMREIVGAGSSINDKLTVLNDKASNINQVVTTITKVADQTNLLSLNAAIEAEKAGEYGRGFSVVASEIRRLSDQTAVATYDIEQMVKEIRSAVSAGVMGMDKFSEEVRRGMQKVGDVAGQLSQIIQHVQALAPRVESVNEGMRAQASGAEQITQALTQLSEAIQQTVESSRQSGLAIDELNQISRGLRESLSRVSADNGIRHYAS
jgi:methyl-accepting chemotaxis protein